jgi:hypothetical protein
MLKWILKRQDGVVWTGLIWLRIGTSEHGTETSGSIKCWEVLVAEQLMASEEGLRTMKLVGQSVVWLHKNT